MAKLWSFSTTLRSPHRIIDFIKVLTEIEGEEWNRDNQEKYQILLIKNRKYEPEEKGLSDISKEILNNVEKEMTYEEASRIFYEKDYQDPSMRGRTSFSPLRELGLAYINENNNICISEVAKQIVREEVDFSDFFLKWALKWQYPNPMNNDFVEGYNIKPLIATIKLINKVNEKWASMGHEPVGISKNELAIFVLSLTNINDVNSHVDRLIDYRVHLSEVPSQNGHNYYKNYIQENLTDFSNATISNIRDYTDNIIRYFSLTSLLRIRGNGYYIDVVPSRLQYISALLAIDDGSSNNYESKHEYLNYLCNMRIPTVELDNSEVRAEYINEISNLITQNDIFVEELPLLNNYELRQLVNLKKKILFKLEKDLYLNSEGITKIINNLEGIRSLEISASLALERWLSTSLIVLNDAEEIKPNFSSDEDNNIIFTAPSGKADIECFYKEFSSICEVTMLTGRNQWHNEGQPVMRHFSDFIRGHNNENNNYCLFIAPQIHRDTLNTFWFSLKYEYEGLKLKIIPLSLRRFEEIMYAFRKINEAGTSFSRNNLRELFDSICDVDNINSSLEWENHIHRTFEKWKEKLLQNVQR